MTGAPYVIKSKENIFQSINIKLFLLRAPPFTYYELYEFLLGLLLLCVYSYIVVSMEQLYENSLF